MTTKRTERDNRAHTTANYLRTILASALAYKGDEIPVDLVNEHGLDANGTLRIEIALSPEDAHQLAEMLNRADVRSTQIDHKPIQVKIWTNTFSGAVWVSRVSDNVALRDFGSERTARKWCEEQGVEVVP